MQLNSAPTPTLRDLGFLDPNEAASLIDVKPLTLANWRAAEKGPPFTKIHGNKIVYPLDGLKRWLSERTVQPEKPATLARPNKRHARTAAR